MTWLSRAIADGAVQVFEFDDASGTQATEKSGNNRHGAYVNTPTLGVAGIGDGKTAASFDRPQSERVNLDTAGLPTGASPYAIEVLVRPDQIDASQGLAQIGKTGVSNQANGLRLGGSSGSAEIHNWWWNNDLSALAKLLYNGDLLHIIAEFDGTKRRIIVNGAVLAEAAASGLNSIPTTPSLAWTVNAEFYDGIYYKAALYANSLGPKKARLHYRDLVPDVTPGITDPRDIPGIRGWYSSEAITGLADGAALTLAALRDKSGKNNHPTAVAAGIVYHATGGFDNGPWLEFDAAGENITLPDIFNGCTEGYMLVGLRGYQTAGQNAAGWTFGTDAQSSHLPFSNGYIYDDFGSANRKDTITPHTAMSAWHQYGTWSKAGDWGIRQDGITFWTTTSNTVSFNATPKLGIDGSYSSGSIGIAWAVMLDHKPTAQQQSDLEAYFRANPGGGLAPDRPVTAAPSSAAAVPLNNAAYFSWVDAPLATSHEYRVDGGTPVAVAAGTSKLVVSGLTNGVSANLEVRGVNGLGPGPWSSVVAVTPTPMVLYDDFERPNSTTTPGAPVQGGPWTVQQGVAGISSGDLYPPTVEMRITAPGAADVDVETELGGTNLQDNSLIFRWASSSDFWIVQPMAGIFRLYHNAAGVFEEHKSVVVRPDWVAGDRMRVRAIGSMIYVYHNDRLVIEATDRFHTGAQSAVGFRMMSTANRIRRIVAKQAAMVAGTGSQVDGTLSLAATKPGTSLYKGRDTKALDIAGES